MTLKSSLRRYRNTTLVLGAILVAGLLAPAFVVAGGAPTGHGLLRVSTSPADLPSVITVSGEARNVGQVAGLELPVGEHEVCFGQVEGYLRPACRTVDIREGQVSELTGEFLIAGKLVVQVEPGELAPTITVNEIERDRAPIQLILGAGSHEVCFEELSGYQTPPCEVVAIVGGRVTEVMATYAPSDGSQPDPEQEFSRVEDGLVALYDFTSDRGTSVADVAGVHDDLDLTIADPSAVTWTADGLRLDHATLLHTRQPPAPLYDAVADSDEFTVEAWVTPANINQNGPARVVTLGHDTTNTNFFLGQGEYQGASDMVEARLHERTGDWFLRTSSATLSADLTHLVMTRGRDGIVSLYIDGELRAEATMAADLDEWDTSYRLGLGNEFSHDRPWLGTYHLVALYDRALESGDVRTNYSTGLDPEFPEPDDERDAQGDDESEGGDVDDPGEGESLPTVEGETPVTMRSEIQERDIRITFDQSYPVGQFVNGDYFVIGEPTIVKLSPEWDGTRHGAMVNPRTGDSHGYHGGLNGYRSELNVAASLPVKLGPGDSLIPTWGWHVDDPGAPSAPSSTPNAPRPSLKQAMVLTVLDEVPPEGSFRPPYSPGAQALHNVNDVRSELLPRLAPPAAAPRAWSTLENRTRYVWLDHKGYWTGRYIHPSNNMADYGRDLAADVNEAILRLMLDEPLEAKRTTLIQVVQLGIDLAAVVDDSTQNGRYYGDFGGTHGVGRKWPILFTATLLDDPDLRRVASLGPAFWQEDGQTYWSEGGDADPWRSVGDGTWGERAWTRSGQFETGRPGNTAYRAISSMTWNSAVLGAIIMDLADEWGHDPLFDYTDWYMDEERSRGENGRSFPPGSSGGFLEDMWDTHRPNYSVPASSSGHER